MSWTTWEKGSSLHQSEGVHVGGSLRIRVHSPEAEPLPFLKSGFSYLMASGQYKVNACAPCKAFNKAECLRAEHRLSLALQSWTEAPVSQLLLRSHPDLLSQKPRGCSQEICVLGSPWTILIISQV